MKTILCPTDFSKNSVNSVLYAVELARKFKSTILLLHAYETPVIYTDATIAGVAIDYAAIHEAALKQLHKFQLSILPKAKGIRFELVLQQGLPSARITETAIEKRADLIVMATSASSEMQRLLIGSNASRVIREATCDVLMVPPKAKYSGIGKIVFTTDLSDENLLAATHVATFAQSFNAELIFLNIDNKRLVHDERDLERVTSKIRQHIRYPKSKGFLCTDVNTADGITYFLKQEKADCLAMATHHRSLLKSITNPSITKRVSLKTDIPVLVTHMLED
jgi:nucleotide-binding universal stress UspA family protein